MPRRFLSTFAWPRAAFERSPSRVIAGLLVCAAIAVVAQTARAASPRERRFAVTKLGIAGQTPAGWQLSHHTGYAETIVAMLHPDRSHISVTASPTEATSSRALFDLSRPGLEAQSLVVEAVSEHGAWLQIDIRSADGQRRLRQLYRVRTAGIIRQAIILTLSTSQMAFKSHTGDLDYAAEALEFSEPTDPRYARPDSAGAPDAGQR